MIRCLSCRSNSYLLAQDIKKFRVSLISSELPDPLPTSGTDVEELPNNLQFALGSRLYIVNGSNGSEVYIYESDGFVLYIPKSTTPTEGDDSSPIVNIGLVDYMILTE